MRLFFALWPPAETAAALAEWALLVKEGAGGKATPAEKIHLTLAFLGDADAGAARAAAVAVRGRRFDLPIDSAKYVKRNRMVWVGPQTTPSVLLELFDGLKAALAGKDIALEERPFAAHVTLLRDARRPAAIPPLPTVAWPVPEFILVNSTGGRYQALERFPLGK